MKVRENLNPRLRFFFLAVCYTLLGFIGLQIGLQNIWPYWHTASIGFIDWRDVFSFPYILAGTTLVPATLSIAVFSLMLIAKLTTEPARVMPEVYMTFVTEELGGTQAAGIIIFLSVIIGTVVGLIWPVN